MIVATAGHVDHGKTALIHALTGVETDRLPEEKKRGLTIDLGFAYLPLADGTVLGFIDVPGHEKFLRNMVAGVAGIDIALLVVAADDGIMPQTIEHLAVLDLLGVKDGLVALTKTDLVESNRVASVENDIRALLADTHLAGSPVFPAAALAGTGIDDLRAHLETLAVNLSRRASTGTFRLAVDRSFTIPGAGTVVTGTVFSGHAAAGDRLNVVPAMREVRLRGIHAQDRPSDEARAGWRCALNLAGVERDEVARGDWIVASGAPPPSRRLDIRLRVLASEGNPLKHWTPVHVHHGAAHLHGHVAVIGAGSIAPGEMGLAQLVLDTPAVAASGDAVVLRDQSAQRTLGGGRVIDPAGPARGRARPGRIAVLEALDRRDDAAALAARLDLPGSGVALEAFRRSRNLTEDEAATLFAKADLTITGRGDDAVGLSPVRWAALLETVEHAVGRWHGEHLDRLGPTLEELRRAAAWGQDRNLLQEVLAALVGEGRLQRRGMVVHKPGHDVRLNAKDEALWQQVRAHLSPDQGSPPALWQLAETIGSEPETLDRFLGRLAGMGLVMRIARNRYLTPEDAARYGRVAEQLASNDEPGLTAASFRDAAGVGRNFAIDLLEFLDRAGLTLRQGARRSLRRSAADVFGAELSPDKDRAHA
ncbi:MAG: selenocysteine-specific translation elongation factor [Pseudomonadota bacterium]